MDALSDVLKVTHLTGGVFLRADFFAPWCMAARVPAEQCHPALGPASHIILYHYVVEGALRIRIADEDREDLVGAGEAILLPRNDAHLMGSDLSLPRRGGATSSIRPRTAACSPYITVATENARRWYAAISVARVPRTIR